VCVCVCVRERERESERERERVREREFTLCKHENVDLFITEIKIDQILVKEN
jgi:hypothetical protein